MDINGIEKLLFSDNFECSKSETTFKVEEGIVYLLDFWVNKL